MITMDDKRMRFINKRYHDIVRTVQKTRPILTADYGLSENKVLQDQYDAVVDALKTEKDTKVRLILEQQKRDLESRMYTKTMNAEKRIHGEYEPDGDEVVPGCFKTILDAAINERAKENHLNGLTSHDKMISIEEHLKGVNKKE